MQFARARHEMMRVLRLARAVPLLLTLAAGLGACTTLTQPPQAIRQAASAAPSGDAPAPASPATATAAPTQAAAARADNEPRISPDAQQAFDHARRALRAGRLDDAERGFRALTQSHPDLGGPHANLGVIHRQAGKLPEALAALEKAVALSPRQPLFFNQLGVTYRQAGRFDKARDAYDQALALDPNYADATLNLAILHDLYLWDGQRALELYDRYLALSPTGDATVTKWVADLKNRKQHVGMLMRKEKE